MIASAQELDFTIAALAAGCVANVASAFRGQENKRVLADPALKEAIGSAANVYAITTLWATVFLFPVIFVSGEYAKMDAFRKMWAEDGLPGSKDLCFNTLMAGAILFIDTIHSRRLPPLHHTFMAGANSHR